MNRKLCRDCGQEKGKSDFTSRCGRCHRAHIVYQVIGSGQCFAVAAVTQAKAKKLMLPASAYKCVDCGCQAFHYEHRDYGRPLDVEPVCRKCNKRRGPAKRKPWSFDEFFDYYQRTRFSDMNLTRDEFQYVRRRHWPEEMGA